MIIFCSLVAVLCVAIGVSTLKSEKEKEKFMYYMEKTNEHYAFLEEKGIKYTDIGTYTQERTDYPIFAEKVARKILDTAGLDDDTELFYDFYSGRYFESTIQIRVRSTHLHCPLSIVHCPLPIVHCPLSIL